MITRRLMLTRPARVRAVAGALLSAVLSLAGYASPTRGDSTDVMPKPHEISYFSDGFRQSIRPLTRTFDLSNGIRKATGNRREAENVDEQDQVRQPTTWWTPRVGHRAVTPEVMLESTGSNETPAEGRWTVVKAKSEGVSPGFQIVDGKGARWAIKFDPPSAPELTTGADVVTSKLYWAAGFNVPTNVIITIRRELLDIKPGLTAMDPLRGKLDVDDAYLDGLLSRVARNPDGTWRAVASKFLKGKPLGELSYEHRRKDDPEDLIPHFLRRELRGMWAVNAWLHHDDCSARNTLDMWVTDGGRSFVRHYFLDFSGTLGAASVTKHSYRSGYEYNFDFNVAAWNLITLGLIRPRWEHAKDPEIPSAGFFDVETFDPEGWRAFLPNAAFDARTERDVVWGTRIVAGFDEALIRAAVKQGKYTDPKAEEYIVQTLLGRRDKLVARWLPGTTASTSR